MKSLLCVCVLLCAAPTFAADEPATFYSDLTPAAFTPTDGPLTNAMSLRVRTDDNGYLLATLGTYGGTDGPLTAFGNLRLRTDSNGYLLVGVPAGAGVSVVGAKYIVQQADATLTAEQATGALATGIVKNTTTTGVLSIAAAGTDYQAPITCPDTGVVFADGANLPACQSSLFRYTKGTNEGQFKLGELFNGTFYTNYHLGDSSAIYLGPNDTNGDYGGHLILEGDATAQYARIATLFSGGAIATAPTAVTAGSGLFQMEHYGYFNDGLGTVGMRLGGAFYAEADVAFDGVVSPRLRWLFEPSIDVEPTFGIDIYGALVTNGNAIHGDSTTAHTWKLQAYDTDTGYVAFGTFLNGTAPKFTIAPPAGGGTVELSANIVQGSGGTPAVTDTSGGNSCGAAGDPTMVSGSTNIAGHFNVGAGGGTDCTLTFTVAATNKWVCAPSDETSAVLVRAVSVSSTVTKFQGVLGAADKVAYICTAY